MICHESELCDEPQVLSAEPKMRVGALGAKMAFVLKRDDFVFPTFWPLQIVGWSCYCGLVLVSILPSLKQPGTLRGSSVFVGSMFVASCMLRPVCQSLIKREFSWIALEIRAFVWSMIACAIAAYVAELLAFGVRPLDWADWLVTFTQAIFTLFLWSSLYFSIKLWQQSAREKERLLRAESEVRDARLNAMRYQLNPHFLFNSLNAVSTLVLDGNARLLPACSRRLANFSEPSWTVKPRWKRRLRTRLLLPSSTWRSSRADWEAGYGLTSPSLQKPWTLWCPVCCYSH